MSGSNSQSRKKVVYTLGGKVPPSFRDKAKRQQILAEIDVELGRTRDPKKARTLIKRLVALE